MSETNYLYWAALAQVPQLGARLEARLLRAFGSPEAIFRASLTTLSPRAPPDGWSPAPA